MLIGVAIVTVMVLVIFTITIPNSGAAQTAPSAEPVPTIVAHIVSPDADQSIKDALADGIATREEYDQAIAKTMACLEENGFSHSTPKYDESKKQYTYMKWKAAPPESGPIIDDDCSTKFELDIQMVWLSQQWAPTMTQEEAESFALKCVAALGLTFSSFDKLRTYWESTPSDSGELKRCVKIGIYRVYLERDTRPWETPTATGGR